MTPTYKINVHDRNYTTWEIFETTHFQKVQLNIDPFKQKLFANDVFTTGCSNTDCNCDIKLLHSSIRSGTHMPGVLLIEGNKTYGRHKSGAGAGSGAGAAKKPSKLLYKCVPDDMRLPAFLIPYEIKEMGFFKVFTNLYVTFTFSEWKDKHPVATLTQVIGTVDKLPHFYEYQLYCKSLNASIQKFQRDATKAIERGQHSDFVSRIQQLHPSIVDRQDWTIFSIDPAQSLDYDDAFSIARREDGNTLISIYISNVTLWMDALQLWSSFSRRISTIYLPDKKRPMLPTILSEGLCSLQEKMQRIAFTVDILIDQDGETVDVQFHNCLIRVHKNFVYEEPDLFTFPDYVALFNTVKLLSQKWKYMNSVKTSHDVVCYLMILMNYLCAKNLMGNKCGIFRSTLLKRDCCIPDHVPEEVAKFIKIWNSAAGQYIDAEKEKDTIAKHDLLELDAYIHMTSPIRRLVDLLNMIQFQKVNNMISLSEECIAFYYKWLNELDYINVTMRSIRKVQCECSLLDLCCNREDTMEKEYEGYVFDRLERNDGLFQYIIYLPELKLSSRITMRSNFENFTNKKVKLHLFHDEEKFKRKIRLEVLNK